jgi:ketosteroid isomerase-like protein
VPKDPGRDRRRRRTVDRSTEHLEIEGVLADDERGVSFEHITAERDGKTLDVRDTTVFRFQDGKVAEMWMLSTDLDAHEAFWS